MRCDERRPGCANCEKAERSCAYPLSQDASGGGDGGGREQSTRQRGFSPISPSGSVAKSRTGSQSDGDRKGDAHASPSPDSSLLHDNHLPGLSMPSDGESQAAYTPEHLVLLRHADTVPGFSAPGRRVVDIAVRHAADAPYLMDEVLAFTALHLTHLYPASAVHLSRISAELQTRALTSFAHATDTATDDEHSTILPRYLFTGILGRHALADTLAYHRFDFHSFIDRFVECFNLNRDIIAIHTPTQGPFRDTEIEPFVKPVLDAHDRVTSPGTECAPLQDLMHDSDLGEASKEACRKAIDLLQSAFDICHNLDEDDYLQAVSAFSVKLEADFVAVLRKHRPEALLILAYYGILLHRCRTFWAFCDAGSYMIHDIAEHLGAYWRDALSWPLQELENLQGGQDFG
ncbi:hypothetical protein CBER1_11299 [Cercospora berteroae]|uniref:Zn(2)-C6 fungal-type domain-containing protein n=1 Tax=Cercospora berteroae TaxID=357750 RepID=A0A2S6BZB7_9PEZI|nr:hypothetical protein CBER1_11299 [Cercospora berteroae]